MQVIGKNKAHELLNITSVKTKTFRWNGNNQGDIENDRDKQGTNANNMICHRKTESIFTLK